MHARHPRKNTHTPKKKFKIEFIVLNALNVKGPKYILCMNGTAKKILFFPNAMFSVCLYVFLWLAGNGRSTKSQNKRKR